jgi:hypothetical protein
MATVKVYYFRQFSIQTGKTERSLRPATREAITGIRGASILEETAQEVDESELDGNGFYTRSENLYSDQPPKR